MVIIGLGNPGPRYLFTRHNAGFLYIDALLEHSEVLESVDHKLFQAWRVFFEGKEFHAVKPLTYMNLSGVALSALKDLWNLDNDSLMVVYDDFDLPLGRIRLRKKGSAGHHKGMLSILNVLQTDEVKRIRIGIGPKPPGVDMAEYVLSEFSELEMEILAKVMYIALEATRVILKEGFDKAMSIYNSIEVVTG